MTDRVHAFSDDALAEHDAVALAELVRDGAVSPQELAAAAAARAAVVDPQVHAIAYTPDAPRFAGTRSGAWSGVPTYVKDNADMARWPTNHGSAAFRARPAAADDQFTRQFLSTGVTVLGKTRMPEFGLTASTEYQHAEPCRNPWNTEYSVGGSSGGAAALVAAGVVPIAHGNDGGGSLRIPGACAGLVALKPSRFRHRDNLPARQMLIKLISEGVLTRTVRDTAAYVAAAEDYWRNPKLVPIGMVHGPANRRLRVGVLTDTVTGDIPDAETLAAVQHTATLLEQAGHHVEPIALPFRQQLGDDFLLYWALLADLITLTGKQAFGPSFERTGVDKLTSGLARYHRERLRGIPAVLLRLRRAARTYATMFDRHELIISPVLTHVTPPLGHLDPNLPTEQILDRLTKYAGFTPIANTTGAPAISVPMGMGASGVPIGVMLSAAYGDERTLLETAYLLEAAHPFPRINA